MHRNAVRWIITVVAAGAFAAAGRAQSIEEEARSLLKAMNVEAQYRQMQTMLTQQIRPALGGLSGNLPEEKRAAFLEKANQLLAAISAGEPTELFEAAVKIYSKRYSIEEMKGLQAFYATPLGRKLLAETPGISSEMMTSTMTWNQAIANKLLGDLAKDFPELNSPPAATGSPAAPPDPDSHQH